MLLTETTMMVHHRQCSWQNRASDHQRSSKGGMSYESLVDYESQRIKKIVLSTTVTELYSLMKCFGSCQFLSELLMDLSGEVATIHMRTDAKNR